jgi:hypothetical protein
MIIIKNMAIKKKLILFLVFFFIFFFPFFVLARENDSFSEMANQGNIRTCLKAQSEKVKQDGWKSVTGTIRLTGECLSKSGCQIWQCNTNNKEIEENSKILEKCDKKDIKVRPAQCDDPEKVQKLRDKIAKSVEAKPGCKDITSSIVSQSKNYLKDVFSLFTNVFAVGPTAQGGKVSYGPVNTVVAGNFIPHVNYTFYAIGEANPVNEETGKGVDQGSDSSLKQSTVEFSFEKKEGAEKDCVAISWDPYGRVFDAVSLEPMSDIKVTLIDANTGKPVNQQFENNFDITNLRGVYNILVEKEGFYKIDVEPPQTHIFTNDLSKLSSAYSEIYSDIYKKDDVYEEKKGVPTHHDIPLIPKGLPYTQAVAEVLEGSLRQVDMGSFVNYSGKVTFPKAKVCLVGKESKKVIDCVNADKFGNFVINIKKSFIPYEKLLIVVEKVDLTKPIIKNNNVDFTKIDFENTPSFEPIFNYLEGYAYESNNKIIPYAKVLIKLKMNDKVFYQTTGDNNGFLKIDKKNLPFFEYYLEFIDPKTSVKVTKTTSNFFSENKIYIDKNGLKLIEEFKITPKLTPTKNLSSTSNRFDNGNNTQTNVLTKEKEVKNNKLYLSVLILFFLIFILFFVLFYFYLKNKI